MGSIGNRLDLKLAFRIVNVFTRHGAALSGNPLCVFEDARGLDAAHMQALAQQMTLSETTFIFPPSRVDAVVRIYTPAFEMPFAGHPTLGTAHVVHALGAMTTMTLEMHAGDIVVRSTAPGQWQLRTAGGLLATVPAASTAELAAMLQLPTTAVDARASWINTGSDQLIIPVASPADVAAAAAVPELLARHGRSAKRTEPIAYVWAWADAAQTQVVARTFFMAHGAVIEDPATGSACANLGGWLRHTGEWSGAARHVEVSQGDSIGRQSTLHLDIDSEGAIFVSGDVIELGRGELAL